MNRIVCWMASLTCVLAGIVSARPADALPVAITGVTASSPDGTTSGGGSQTAIQSTVDGTDLSSYSFGATDLTNHVTDITHTWQSGGDLQGNTFPPVVVTYNFSSTATVDSIAFWNFNEDFVFGNNDFGIEDVSFSYFNGSSYVPITGAPTTFAQAIAGTFDGPQLFSFTAVETNSIQMSIFGTFLTESSPGAETSPGYNAILFGNSGAPELDPGSSLAPLCFALGCFALAQAKRA